jgi:hypothetical protein
LAALPTFLVVGADKCGTTSLHHYLGEHPEVQVSWPKELHFFNGSADPTRFPAHFDDRDRARMDLGDGTWHRGLDWYGAHFDPAFAARGESTPNYSAPWYPGTADRIAAAVPDVSLIYCVRDPVRRALSSYTFRRAMGTDARAPGDALLPNGFYAARSRYADCLEPFLSRFGRERILIVEAEDLDGRRSETLRRVFAFLGVDEDFWSERFERRWNVTAEQRGARYRVLRRLRRLPGWERAQRAVPRRAVWLAERATRRADGAAPEPPTAPPAFVESLREDAARFRVAVGHDFPDWSV